MPPENDNLDPAIDEIGKVVADGADAAKAADLSADAPSSSAADVKNPVEATTLSIVRDVVEGKKEAEPAASSASSEPEAKAPASPPEQDNENYSDVPFNQHPRFQHLLGNLKEARTDAQRYRNVETFINDQGLSAEEAADLLVVGGLAKTDPVKALERVKPWVQKLAIAAGEILPDDLKTMVDSGDMTREAALQVSRSRAQVNSVTTNQRLAEQRAQERQQAELGASIANAVSEWEEARKERDPNFAAKVPLLQREITFLQATEGKPKDAAGVKKQLQKAYDAIVAPAATAAPTVQKPAITPVNGGAVNGSVRPEINDTIDVVNNVLARRRAG